MKDKIFLGIQILSGLMLVVFGLNKFLHFMPMPPMSPEMVEYMTALMATGFMFPLIAVIEILAGLAFISNKFAGLMAIIVTPVIVNALLAHIFLDPSGAGGAGFILFAIIIVMIRHKDRYSEIFKA
ncbi:MAG: hypothetical protein QM493_09030 [Sulfurovum sp.]